MTAWHRVFGAFLCAIAFGAAAQRGDCQGMDNRLIKDKPAGLFSMRSPSDCVSTTLSWKDDRKLDRLEVVGPADMDRQRAIVTQIGEAIVK